MKDERDHCTSVPAIIDGLNPVALTLIGFLHPEIPCSHPGAEGQAGSIRRLSTTSITPAPAPTLARRSIALT